MKAARQKMAGQKVDDDLSQFLKDRIPNLSKGARAHDSSDELQYFITEEIDNKIDEITVAKHELGNVDYKNVHYRNTIRDGEITFFRYTDIHEMSGGVLGCDGQEDSISMLAFIKDIPIDQIVIEVVNNQTCELRCWDVKALAKSLITMSNLNPLTRQRLSYKYMQVIAETLRNITPEQRERLDELLKESDTCFDLVTRCSLNLTAFAIVAVICPLVMSPIHASSIVGALTVQSFIAHYSSYRSPENNSDMSPENRRSLHVRKNSYDRVLSRSIIDSREYYSAIEQLSKNCVAKIKIEKKKQEKKKQEKKKQEKKKQEKKKQEKKKQEKKKQEKKKQEKKKQEKKKQEKKKQEKKKQEKKKQEAGRKVVANDSSSSYKSPHKSDKSRKRSRS